MTHVCMDFILQVFYEHSIFLSKYKLISSVYAVVRVAIFEKLQFRNHIYTFYLWVHDY